MPVYDCRDPECEPCKRQFRQTEQPPRTARIERMARHIAAGVISFVVSLIVQYMFKAFTDWNILWISAVPSWSSYDRTGMLLCMTCIPIIPAVSAFMISSLYYPTGDTPR